MLYKSDIEELSVSLRIESAEISPNEITKQLEVEPTEIIVKGEYRIVGKKNPRKILNKTNIWFLKSPLPQTVEPDKHLEYLLKIIRPKKGKFMKVLGKYESGFSFGIHFNYCNPGITLDKDVLKEISDLNTAIYFDMYYLNMENEE